ncbi:hypothetical protein NPIL_221681 [Nephila pilipes]|uniref:Uncharacterized protein n=1 Tax=Nephila pilipes TaxID=299642 RepID=A0A8X6QJJ5_NEPPI|nr:hypothetical protein NPIL_221681 [Nephila pilipes]
MSARKRVDFLLRPLMILTKSFNQPNRRCGDTGEVKRTKANSSPHISTQGHLLRETVTPHEKFVLFQRLQLFTVLSCCHVLESSHGLLSFPLRTPPADDKRAHHRMKTNPTRIFGDRERQINLLSLGYITKECLWPRLLQAYHCLI